MTNIEQKALALANAVSGTYRVTLEQVPHPELMSALCHAIEQHEAFRQEVSNPVEYAVKALGACHWSCCHLNYLIIPKP